MLGRLVEGIDAACICWRRDDGECPLDGHGGFALLETTSDGLGSLLFHLAPFVTCFSVGARLLVELIDTGERLAMTGVVFARGRVPGVTTPRSWRGLT